MLTRRSTRLSRTNKVSLDTDNEKRKRSISKEELGSSTRRTTDGRVVNVKKTKDGRMVDAFCWVCHKLGDDKICSTCPRVYHSNCIAKTNKFTQEDVCPECQLQSVDGTKPTALSADMIDKVLVCLIRRLLPIATSKSFGGVKNDRKSSKIKDKISIKPELMKWPQREYKTCKPVDIGMLVEAIKSGGSYSTIVEFFSDVKWIYHNSCKFFGVQSAITKAANKLVSAVKSELLDIEACYECYYRNYNEIEAYDCDPFSMLCTDPHTVIWGKLKGHPFWPSKCLKVIDGMAQIQFFGTHDKNSVPAETCYLISRRNPNLNFVGRKTYEDAIKDLGFYIQNYERKYGPYPYAACKVKFLPADDWHWVKKKLQPSSIKRKYNRKSTQEKSAPIRQHQVVYENGSSQETAENEESEQATGGDTEPSIVISSVRGISIADAFQNHDEPQSAQNSYQNESFTRYQTVGNSWSPDSSQLQFVSYSDNSPIHCPNLTVCIPRLDDSVAFQYQKKNLHQTNSRINFSISQPVFTSLQSCHESTQNAHDSISRPEHSSGGLNNEPTVCSMAQDRLLYHPESSTPSTSRGRMPAFRHSENINNCSRYPSNDNANNVGESYYARNSNEHLREEMTDITSLIGINENLRITDPEVWKIAADGGHFIKQSGQLILQYSNSYAKGHDIVRSILKKLKSLDSALKDEERKKAELKANACETFNPVLAQIINGTKKMAENRIEAEFTREKERLDTEINNVRNMLLFHNKECSKLINITMENRRNKETQTDLLTEDEQKFEEEMAAEQLKFEQNLNDEILEVRSKSWCIKCQRLGTIYCCWNTYYCTEECRALHFEVHQPLCWNLNAHSGHSVMIEEITGSEACEDSESNMNSSTPMIEES